MIELSFRGETLQDVLTQLRTAVFQMGIRETNVMLPELHEQNPGPRQGGVVTTGYIAPAVGLPSAALPEQAGVVADPEAALRAAQAMVNAVPPAVYFKDTGPVETTTLSADSTEAPAVAAASVDLEKTRAAIRAIAAKLMTDGGDKAAEVNKAIRSFKGADGSPASRISAVAEDSLPALLQAMENLAAVAA